jgi:hypothetical protein
VDTHVLLWGDNTTSIKENEKLFSIVQLFIKRSRQTLIKNLTILKEILNSNLCARG